MKTILIPTDFSESAFNAACYAASLTRIIPVSTLILYHSNTIPSNATELSMLHEHTREMLQDFKKKMLPYLGKGASVEIRTDELPLSVAIDDLARRHSVELVVMATSGKGTVERAIVGSNTLNVAKDCSIPLLLIPEQARFHEIRKILFAVDLKDLKGSPMETINRFCKLINANLIVLHVEKAEKEFLQADVLQQQGTLQTMLGEDIDLQLVQADNIASGIKEFALSNQVDLIALAVRKHGFFEALFHQSITKEFAYYTSLPLLLLK